MGAGSEDLGLRRPDIVWELAGLAACTDLGERLVRMWGLFVPGEETTADIFFVFTTDLCIIGVSPFNCKVGAATEILK